ncbi:MAG TPA: N-succinylarginine dihydrolase, partial [Gemmataceae bacterium]|nr:N-succinylarginine dihydrolase [Gemmataceae bacterium]
HGGPGVHLFVYGRDAVTAAPSPHRFRARQTRQASRAVCRQNRLATGQLIFAQQNPEAVDAGVFHNDVIATSHRDIFFFHECAYVNTPGVIERICDTFTAVTGGRLRLIEVGAAELPLELAVRSYLFNSQLVTAPDGRTILVAPTECHRIPRVRNYLEALTSRPACPIDSVEFVEVNQSMRGGGGPACLRLRVPLTAAQLRSLGGNVLLTDALFERLVRTVSETYPESVSFADLSNGDFLETCRAATARIYAVLELV